MAKFSNISRNFIFTEETVSEIVTAQIELKSIEQGGSSTSLHDSLFDCDTNDNTVVQSNPKTSTVEKNSECDMGDGVCASLAKDNNGHGLAIAEPLQTNSIGKQLNERNCFFYFKSFAQDFDILSICEKKS